MEFKAVTSLKETFRLLLLLSSGKISICFFFLFYSLWYTIHKIYAVPGSQKGFLHRNLNAISDVAFINILSSVGINQ